VTGTGKKRLKRALLFCIAVAIACATSLYAADTIFPAPKGYERWIPFWTTIFTAYNSNQFVITDARCPEAMYAVLEIKEQNNSLHIINKKNLKKEDKNKNILEILSKIINDTIEIKYLQTADNLAAIYSTCGYTEDVTWQDIRLKLQRGNKDKLKFGIIRYGLYKNQIETILKQYGLPTELSYLPLIESNYWMYAHSNAGALGVWQFMPGTGKNYLTINKYIDERLDPIKSTHAAAKYLKQAYTALGSWDVTITSYNYGNLGMINAVKTLRTNDLSIILKKYKSRSFQYASRNFYLEFLAIKQIMSDIPHYYPNLEMLPALEYQTVVTRDRTTLNTLIKSLKIEPSVFKLYNPSYKEEAYKRNIIITENTEIQLPPDSRSDTRPKILAHYNITLSEINNDIAKQFNMSRESIIALNAINEQNFAKRNKNYLVILK
jgi:peptidoglycan lytic transglycosylase D